MSETGRLQVSPLDRLVVLRGILKDPVVGALHTLLATDPSDDVARTRAYAELAFQLFSRGDTTLREQVLAAVLDDENIYLDLTRAGEEPSRALRMALECDLRNIQAACAGTADDLKGEVCDAHLLPSIQMGIDRNFVVAYHRCILDEEISAEDLIEEARQKEDEPHSEPKHLQTEQESEQDEPIPTEESKMDETEAEAETVTEDAPQKAPDGPKESDTREVNDEGDSKLKFHLPDVNLPKMPEPVAKVGKRITNWLKN